MSKNEQQEWKAFFLEIEYKGVWVIKGTNLKNVLWKISVFGILQHNK